MTDIVKADAVEVMGTDPVQQLFAMAGDLDPEALERMVALAERVQDRNAAQAMQDAHAAFQAVCPPIEHNQKAGGASKGGSSWGYTYASLDQIAETVRPHLLANGLSYTWDSAVVDGAMSVTCTLRHIDGGTRTATFVAPIETNNRMSGPQSSASALTYGRRQSLVQVLGLTTADTDTDALKPADDNATITKQQAERVMEMIDKAGAEAGDRVLKWAKVSKVADLPASKYGDAMYSLTRAAEQNDG